MATTFSARSRAIEPFHVMALLARANELQAAGHDVIHLEIGEPDFTTAAPIVEAGQKALANGHTRYTAARGLPALREAIAGFYAQRYGLSIDPQRILVTPGGSGALLLASSLLVDPGKHWLLADPGYPCNRHFLRLVEGAAQLVPVGPESRYQLTPELVERHWDQDSVGALAASPANPTGTLLHKDELAALSSTLKARGGHLVVDEIYHGLTYGIDASSVLEVDDDAFVLNSFSKYFGMTGWRLGWLVAPQDAVGELEKLAQNLYISAPSMAQHAALACFEPATLAILEERREEFRRRRDYLLPALRELGFGIAVEPEGAFYLYADISAFGGDAFAFCQHFIETEHVAFTPGVDFGRYQASHHVRFAYTQSVERLQQAVERIARGLKTWRP
ncbi:pyridoxal phosphate-dependent aminotransferase [Pseudomonas sp. GD04087]|uniref:pyridoxal phosphate-dependent aminotransferase n=1 Tax=Pseudomonas TaxID=286 RepID=UPI001F244A08|nr:MULTISPECIES: pyridoxal phosphate-dependent aminotransferase [Pseudomonas]MCP1651992.1 aspartate/methionine/tyrosine aminotransferase [Pseudomonas nitroreducens]MCP1689475.1 aspartate/methionine/tyrosine aminotransferase [Pseudomonas nitroreducens]MDH0290224.1 pyridoxal phosphate-dependent aminotransferase [Pseudomonas sp. GD04087]MDH1049958.1 pyridoxal phosphate-dependent aminotransferase [Pseudomonas sp. GD03903]MDH1998225.1 pyridoxal phosphate-dependent aminotransferase [Pseudomonas sp. 